MVSLELQLEPLVERAAMQGDSTDFAKALASGPNTWVTADSAATPMLRAGFALSLTGVLAMGTVTITEIVYQDHGRSVLGQGILALVTVVTMAMLGSSTIVAIRRQRHRGGRRSVLVWRVAALMVFSAIWISTVPPALSLLVWPLGLFIGAEAAVIALLIGHERDVLTLYGNYFTSALHFGAVSAAFASVLIVRTPSVARLAITGVCSIEIAAIASVLAFGILRQLFVRELQYVQAIQRDERTDEFKRRAHWIHDDVCADLRELRVRMATHTLDKQQVTRELDLLDDRLRERQLDEMLNGGLVAAAEILQSYVRRAQNAGVIITSVPRFEEASVMLGGAPARLLRRVTAGFVANALAAGSKSLAFQLSSDGSTLVLAVTDDAGGFDLCDAPAGRGLASLASDLGPNCLASTRHASGTTMTASIQLVGEQ